MAKTLFGKIFLMTVAIIFVSFILTTVLMYSQLAEYIDENQLSELTTIAEHISEFTQQLVYEENDTIQNIFQKYIYNQSRYTGCSIIIMDSDSEVVATAADGGSSYNDGSTPAIDEKYVKRALKGESVSEAVYGKSGSEYMTDSLLAVVPVVIETDGKEVIWGAVAVSKPMPQIRRLRNNLMSIFVLAQLAAILVAFLFCYVISRRISRPISRLNAAAKAVAAGDFTKKVAPSSGELGELIASFNSMTDSLREIDETRSSFISNVSHELRTPMTIISGFVEGIMDGTIAEEDRTKYLGIVLSETQRLSRLVTELLETSRLESGKIKLVMKPLDINELIRKGIISYEQAITDKKVNVEAEFMYEQTYAYGDEDSIYRVIVNLMDNAIKFVPENGTIKIKSAVKGQKVEVSIENSGDGISEKDLAHIWDRFYKTDKSRSMDKRGVGLGLYLVKTIMNQHGNRIWAESKEGEFTRFTFTLDKVNVKTNSKNSSLKEA